MRATNEGGPRKGRPDNTSQPAESYTDPRPLSEQGELDIPAHPLALAEADLRSVANRLHAIERRHWWLLYLAWLHRDLEDCGCNGCRLGVAA